MLNSIYVKYIELILYVYMYTQQRNLLIV